MQKWVNTVFKFVYTKSRVNSVTGQFYTTRNAYFFLIQKASDDKEVCNIQICLQKGRDQ